MILSNEGKLVDNNGVEVFKNNIFNQLVNIQNLSQATPNAGYVDAQANQVFFLYPDDARKYIEFQVSKLIDDNASLASDETVKNQYIMNVVSFLAILNKVNKDGKEEVKNTILGGVFPTKEDNSTDSMIPMYLCVEMLRAKCLKHLDLPLEELEELDLTPSSKSSKTSTLGNQFDIVVTGLKNLNYDKTIFNQDMSDQSAKYLSECQVVADGSVDIFAKIEDNINLYVTQARSDGNNISQNIVMCELQNNVSKALVENGNLENTQNLQENSSALGMTPEVPAISNDNVQVNYSNQEQVNNLSKMNPRIVNAGVTYTKKRDIVNEKYKEILELKEKLSQLEEAYELAKGEAEAAADELASLLREDNKEMSQQSSANASLFK